RLTVGHQCRLVVRCGCRDTWSPIVASIVFVFYASAHRPDLHSFPTRRSSDLSMHASRTRWRGTRASSCSARTWPTPAASKTSRKDRKSTRLNSSDGYISYAVFCLKKKKQPGMTGSLLTHPGVRIDADSTFQTP